MFRLAQRLGSTAVSVSRQSLGFQRAAITTTCIRSSHEKVQVSDDDIDEAFARSFGEADGWLLRKLMNDLMGMDMTPDPVIVKAAMHACRRLDEYACAVRFLEAVKWKCGPDVGEIWPYMLQEVGPTLKELGISTPEEMGYDKPELALPDVYSNHPSFFEK